jgi:hypothetical protein
MLVCAERIGISIIIIILIILEYLICMKKEDNRRKRHRSQSRVEKYDEMDSDQDLSNSKHHMLRMGKDHSYIEDRL